MGQAEDQRKEESGSLEQLLDSMGAAARGDQVSLDELMDMVGRRSFGSLLLLAGLLTLTPLIGDIPGVPTLLGAFVFLIAMQLLVGMEHFWLPRWLLERSIERSHLETAIRWIRPPARFIDRLLKSRYTAIVNGKTKYLIAVFCIGIALSMPVMEVVPFSANAAGIVLAAFGLSLISRDGLVALGAFLAAGATYVLVAWGIM
jgi:hypothetical protein